MAESKNNNAYVIHMIFGVVIPSMLLLTTVTVLQKQNVYALSPQERYNSGLTDGGQQASTDFDVL